MSDAGSGRRPSGRSRRREVVEAYTVEERRLGRYARRAYIINRSAFESAKQGIDMLWRVPMRYDGVGRASVDPQDADKTLKNVWFEMGRWFARWQIPPIPFVQFVFSRLDFHVRIPEPPQVCNEAYVKGFREFVTKGAVEAVSTAFETQTREAQSALLAYQSAFGILDPERAKGKKWVIVQNVILAPSLPLSPLFRYLLALSSATDAGREGDEEAKSRFLDLARGLFDRAAAQFYVYKDAYTEHWGRWLPKTFPAAATARVHDIAFNEGGRDDDPVG